MEIQGFRHNLISVNPELKSSSLKTEQTSPQASDSVSLGSASAAPETVKINILHLNDVHGVVEPSMDPFISKENTSGGLANIKSVIDRERATNPEGTLTLNAGDIAEGSMEAYLSKGRVITDAFKEIKFDAIELGNHDFAWGLGDLRAMVQDLDTPILGANIVKTDTGEVMDGVQPYILRDLKGIKVAVIGLDTTDIVRLVGKEKVEGLEFRDAAKTLEKYIPEVREKGADLIVVLSHLGDGEDVKLAEAVKGVDLIVGGHSHTVMQNGRKVGDTTIVQAGSMGRFVGNVELEFDPSSKKLVGCKPSLLPVVSGDVKPDPQIEKILAPYIAQAAKFGSEVMGEAVEDLQYGHREALKLNMIHADSILAKSGAPFGICNSRTLRGNVDKGTVTRKDLYNALPLSEEGFCTLNIQGKYIRKHIEDSLADGARSLAVPMGSLKFEYDPSKPSGQRLLSAKLDGKEMEDDKDYSICVNETIARNKNFASAKDMKVVGNCQEEFFDYFRAHSPWDNSIDDRIKIVSSN
ncbi:MAG: bifunctional metallophosphatase/5'-nucleotidase [Firmicutes bacterium]|nr:bifunctional metallophosphatase/5'-nucleotidase [Bacillota bacterium]